MSQGGSANPYSGQASLGGAAGHHGELLAGGADTDEPTQQQQQQQQQGNRIELERMQAAATTEAAKDTRATGASEPQPGGVAAQLKAGAEYLEKEVSVCVGGVDVSGTQGT
jgi:hypothetical protein